MPLLTAQNLAKSFGAEDIFSGITFSIPHRARIGLVGPNGVGKTTLIRILLGLEDASAGTISPARGLRMGYLPQEARLHSSLTLWEEIRTVFAGLVEMQAEMARLEQQMANPRQAEAALEAYGRLQDQFDARGGYTFELRIRQTLSGLGFDRADERRPVDQLSGGQRTRALLAKLLLSEPDLLLLDEPTNHLDIAAVEWLESYLKDWDGGVLIVSHDRYFLDQVAGTIWEMTPALEIYRGNYSAYLTQREERYARLVEEYQAQQEFIEKEEDYIRRNIAGQNTRQAQGRRKRLERLLEESRITLPAAQRRLHMRLQPVGRSGDQVLVTKGLAVGYADEGRPLFHAPDLVLRRREVAAIIGPNGAGKTTFLKTLLEQVPPFAGEVRLGASLQIGYFAQAHEGLHAENTLIEEIQTVAPKMLPAEARDYLAKFLFSGDDVFKTVDLLSGGERGRLALACLALQGANLLLLDEPTNHLDLPSQEVLQAILADFGGTILLVSHDRYLIDALATQIWEVLPDERRLNVFEGSYSEYKAELRAASAARAVPASEAKVPFAPPAVEPAARGEPNLSKNEQWRRQKRLGELEAAVAKLEKRLAEVTRQLENPPADPARVTELGHEYEQLRSELEMRLHEWSEAAG